MEENETTGSKSIARQGAMRLTTARYYTPSGRSIQAVGIEPDIKVEQVRVQAAAAPTRQRTRESDLRGALRNEDGTLTAPAHGSENPAPAQPTQARPTDAQLERALDLIRGVSLFDKVRKG